MSGEQQQNVQIAGAIMARPADEEIDGHVPQPRQPTNLQGLLRFAMEATEVEDAPHASNIGALDEERKKFLENALKSMTVDIVEVLHKNILLLQKAQSLKLDDDISEYLNAFESILEHVDMIDTAIDFHKIGGFIIFPSCLNCVHAQIRASACDLLAELSQNNPYCQKIVADSDLMEQIIHLLMNDADEHVQIKAMYAISCNIRENTSSTDLFLEQRGLEVVIEALQRPNDKLRTKCAFLLSCLVGSTINVRDKLIERNLIPILINLIAQERISSHEHLLMLLWVIVLDNPEAIDICTAQELGLEKILRNHMQLSHGKPDMADEYLRCEVLLNVITSVDPNQMEADR